MRIKMIIKRYLSILLTLVVAYSFCGCVLIFGRMGKPAPYTGEETDLYTIAAYSILPSDLMGTQIEIIEKDTYGRVLYKVECSKDPLFYQCFGEDGPLIAFFICQHSDDQLVYYYEDDCYMVFANAEDFSSVEQIKLKEQNDWNQPLDYNKMFSKGIIPKEKQGYKFTIDQRKIETGEAKEAFLKQIHLNEEEYAYLELLDSDDQGRNLLIVVVRKYKSGGVIDTSTIRSYFEMFVTKNPSEKAVIEEIKDPEHIWIQMKEFKQQNHWRRCQD